MPFDVFNYRSDVRNVVITPQIRSRFLRMEPGEVVNRHSHDLGHEVFLVLEGQCEFEIDGERAILGPGQMCVAHAGQPHRARTIGDAPMTMYLSVTPHVEPTHTLLDEQGKEMPIYGASIVANGAPHPEREESLSTLVARHIAAARTVAEVAAMSAAAQETGVAALDRAIAAADREASRAAVDAMWRQVFETIQSVHELEAAWNELALRSQA